VIVKMHTREWGRGRPVIALHALGLDSSGFEGFGRALASRGMRTIAADLPGFGKTPAPDAPLRPAVLAAPVIELARELEMPPVVLGLSLGGRVALEAALSAPEAFSAVIAIAPALPWRRFRFLLQGARLLDDRLAAWMPLERIWPLLQWLSRALESMPYLRDDEIAQAGMRLVYYFACAATRASFLSAARELTLDPAFGEDGLWTRLPALAVPAAFVWGDRDQLISSGLAQPVAEACPQARQHLLPCVGHWLNGPHHVCLTDSVAALIDELLVNARVAAGVQRARAGTYATSRCLVSNPSLPGGLAPLVPEESTHGR
jgi:pimeloyl-ACP methyl ester carboxylesterase